MRAMAMVPGLVLVGLTAGAQPAPAQGTIAGSWSTEFDIGIRMENGVESSMGKRQATMKLMLQGDSVFGIWQVAAQGGATPSPVRLRGTRSGNKLSLRADPVAHTMNMGDGDRRVELVATYSLEVRGDSLVGTSRDTTNDGSFDSPERPFSATRIKP